MSAPKCPSCGAEATLRCGAAFACASHWTGSRVAWQSIASKTFTPGVLLAKLSEVEARLPLLLTAPLLWQTLDVNYEPPHVERLWHQFDADHRVYLHRIYPCEEALFHPHPWPSAVHILGGAYEMNVGYGPGDVPPPVAATALLFKGSKYEMVDPDGWHSVRPVLFPCYSVMITGPKWDRWSPSPSTKLGPLSDGSKGDLISIFQSYFPNR